MTPRVSAIIPTVGRSTLLRAIESVRNQTHQAAEIIVVADTDQPISVPSDPRISVLYADVPGGPSKARQRGIDAAREPVIAMLDDDDQWCPRKLELQLRAASRLTSDRWIISSKVETRGPGNRRRIWPRRLIEPGQPVADYLFRFCDLRVGGALLQSSTLCFPTALGREVRWDAHGDAIHDEPSWLIAVQRSYPDIPVVQLPEVLSIYHADGPSVSRQPRDLTENYIAWGLHYLRDESPRVMGDYLCTNPVSAAVTAGSARGVRLAVETGLRHGKPGRHALGYAALNFGRILFGNARARMHHPTGLEGRA